MDEEEEMWFSQYDDTEDGEAVVPVADMLSKKIDPELDHIGKMIGTRGKCRTHGRPLRHRMNCVSPSL